MAERTALNAATERGIERRTPARRSVPWRTQGPVLAAIAVGGAIGACARYATALLWPTASGAFPWTTFWVNVSGCAVIGVLMVVITDIGAGHRLVRPFFGTGVLGGFTTFSTYTVDIERLTDTGRATTGLLDLVATALGALAAVWTTAHLTRRVIEWRTS
ncbi:Putative fluoride ion transporter CrcB [Streptomyces griseofuscus]|uniref:Fluoride-specific ion channel FluC n=1 Tax=Streptomyces griseofuscus TaxID=146922 RepID=A0A7H1PSZ0_9ACTN|nr:CrcB protein [Streptomyces murinus]QNT91170.1 Putative fluoride ion transporter CrcB [Streptomyces griseofuscus]BBC92034.1 fluoride efflux transporter CrcB [Streptomyces rochei]